MNLPLVKQVMKAFEKSKMEVTGMLKVSDSHVFIGVSKIHGFMVTGALRIDADHEISGYKLRMKFAVCSDSDRYREDLGRDIAVGRVMCFNDDQAKANGSLSLSDVVKSFLDNKLEDITEALEMKRIGQDFLHEMSTFVHQDIKEEFGDLL